MLYYLISSILTIAAFIMGVKVGIKVRKEEKIEIIPNIPKIIKEQAKEAEQEKVLNELKLIDQNILNYKGTAEGQVEIK